MHYAGIFSLYHSSYFRPSFHSHRSNLCPQSAPISAPATAPFVSASPPHITNFVKSLPVLSVLDINTIVRSLGTCTRNPSHGHKAPVNLASPHTHSYRTRFCRESFLCHVGPPTLQESVDTSFVTDLISAQHSDER